MEEQTGLRCDVSLRGICHIKDEYQSICMQDKYFFVFAATNPQGVLSDSGRTGTNMWMTYDEIEQSGRSIYSGLNILRMALEDHTGLQFLETTHQVPNY